MKTTAIFAELIVVGLEACIWLLLVTIAFVGTGWVQFANALFSNAGALMTLVVVAVAYAVGIAFDELWDELSEPLEDRIFVRARRKEYNNESKWDLQSRLLVQSPHVEDALNYQRGRIRILRSSMFSMLLTSPCALVALLLRSNDLSQGATSTLGVILVAGVFFGALALFSYRRLVKAYWLRVQSLLQVSLAAQTP